MDYRPLLVPLANSLAFALTSSLAAAQLSVEPAWITGLDSPLPVREIVSAAIDRERLVFASELLAGSSGTVVSCYDRSTNRIWTQRFTVQPTNRLYVSAVVADENGGAFVAGSVRASVSFGGAPLGGDWDGFIAHLDSTGAILWAERIGGSGSDSAYGIAASPSGGFYVSGSTGSDPSFGGAALGLRDAFVARYDALGSQLWVTRVGQSDRWDTFLSVAQDDQGGVVCAGRSSDDQSGYVNGLVARLDGSTGAVDYTFREFGSTQLYAVAPDGNGGLAATGSRIHSDEGTFVQVNGLGQQTTFATIAPGFGGWFTRGTGIIRLESGHFAVSGYTRDSWQWDPNRAWIKLYDSTGQFVSELDLAISLSSENRTDAIADNGLGAIVALGTSFDGGVSPPGPFLARLSFGGIAAPGCAGKPNSTGQPGRLQALGTPLRSANSLTLFAADLPPQSLCFFLTSRDAGFTANAGGSQGDLCLGGAVGRFSRTGEIRQSSQPGRAHLDLDLASIPQPAGSQSVMAGETWHYQLWYRDANPGLTSNFTGSVAVSFQ